MATASEEVGDLVRQFRPTLMDMHERRLQGAASHEMGNRLVDRLERLHLRLRTSPEGRRAITAMVFDDNLTVRQ